MDYKNNYLFNISSNIYFNRIYKWKSSKYVSKKINLSEEDYDFLEYNQFNKNIDFDLIQKISSVLNIEISDLFSSISTYRIIEILTYFLLKFDNKIKISKAINLIHILDKEAINLRWYWFTWLKYKKFNKFIFIKEIFDLKNYLYIDENKELIMIKNKIKKYEIFNQEDFKLIDKLLNKYIQISDDELNKISLSLYEKNKKER